MFPVSSKLLPNFSDNFQISFQFFPSIARVFLKALQNTNFLTPMFLHSFFKISSQLVIIRNYSIILTKHFRKTGSFLKISLKFLNKLINLFQNVSVIFLKCLQSYHQGFTKLFGLEVHYYWKCELKVWVNIAKDGKSKEIFRYVGYIQRNMSIYSIYRKKYINKLFFPKWTPILLKHFPHHWQFFYLRKGLKASKTK